MAAPLIFPARSRLPLLFGLLVCLLLGGGWGVAFWYNLAPWWAGLPVVPLALVVGLLSGRRGARRNAKDRLASSLDGALKILEGSGEVENPYALLLDALNSHPGVAGAAIFVTCIQRGTKASGLSPSYAAGALLGLRALPRVADGEHLHFLTKGEELLHRRLLRARVEEGQNLTATRPILSVLEDANLDLIWMLSDEEGTFGAIVLREAIGGDFSSPLMQDALVSRAARFGRTLRARVSLPITEAAPERPRPEKTERPSEPLTPTPTPSEPRPRLALGAQRPTTPPTPAPAVSLPEPTPRPWEPIPMLAEVFSACAPLRELFTAAREAERAGVVRLVSPKESAARGVARALAQARGEALWEAQPSHEAPARAVCFWDEERLGAFRAEPREGLTVVRVAPSGAGYRVPLLEDEGLDAAELASILLPSLAEGRTLSEGARRALRAYRWPGELEELCLVLARAALLTPPGQEIPEEALDAALCGPRPETGELVVTPSADDELDAGEALPGLVGDAMQDGVLEDAPLPFHEAVHFFKRELLKRALAMAGGNRAKAARVLGLQRTYLYRLIRQLEVDEAESQKAFDESTAAR